MNSQTRNFLLLALGIIISLSLLSKLNKPKEKNTRYCGKIVKLYYFNDKSDIMSPRVVFFSDSLQMEIDASIDYNTFSTLEKGKDICIYLKTENKKRK